MLRYFVEGSLSYGKCDYRIFVHKAQSAISNVKNGFFIKKNSSIYYYVELYIS